METEQIDLGKLLLVLLKRSWILFLAAILGACVALVGTFYLVTPKYQSTVTLYVSNTLYAEDLADSFSVIVKMRGTLLDVIKHSQTGRGHQELREMVSVASVNGTDFFELTVSGPDPYEAERLANAMGEILPEKITQIMDGLPVKAVDEAIVAAGPSSPSYFSNALLGAVIGLTLSMGAVLLWELVLANKRCRPN